MQKTDFVAIPNVKAKDYFLTLRQVYNHINHHKPGFKAFRQWMREKGWWDKENAEQLLFMLDVRKGDPVELGGFAREVASKMEEADGREVIGKRLIDLNPLLAKYCLEAMDVENDGRIQSTRELFKLVDSFIYPGKKPKLTEFNAWMAWAEAGGLLRLIGIRWGLSDFARQLLPKLRAIDPDEFLEDEEDAFQELSEGPPEQPEPSEQHQEAPPIVQPAQPEERPVEKVESKSAEPPPPKIEVSRAPVAISAPAAPDFHVILASPAITTADLAKNRDDIKAWWDRYPSKRVPDFSVLQNMTDPQTRLQAFYVALGMGRGYEFNKVMMVAGGLRAAGLFKVMANNKLPITAVRQAYQQVWDLEGAVLVDMAGFLAANASIILKFDFKAFDNPLELLNNLNENVFRGVGGLAPFVAARIAVQAGELQGAVTRAGFIPFFAARQQAFRMGFIDRLYCNDFNELAEDALKLAEFFSADMDYEQPLVHLPGAFGCSFNCGNLTDCPFKCKEKTTPYHA